MSRVDEKLGKYHSKQSSYIKSRVWHSLSANEIVEYNIRTLPFNFSFKSPSVFTRYILLCLLLVLFLLVTPFYIFFSVCLFLKFYLSRSSKLLSPNDTDIFFIRNSLSQKKIELLNRSSLICKPVIVYDDFVASNIEGYGISAYLYFSPLKFIFLTLKEQVAILFDSIINLPEINFTKLVKASFRVPHLCLTYLSIGHLCKNNSIEHLRTFEMISRFSSVLNKVIIDSDIIMSTGYPHGLEYDISYPHGYFGKEFFCTSIKAQDVLALRYPDMFFKYDKKLIECLFKFDIDLSHPKKVVYFTDSRNMKDDLNNINNLSSNIDFVKLHPSDISKYYAEIEVPFIDDFMDAISQGIIIMRASTVIFEGLNSKCVVFCLSTNDKEKYMLEYLYPTLSDEKLNLNIIYSLDMIKAKIDVCS